MAKIEKISVPTDVGDATRIPLRRKYIVGAVLGGQKSKSNNNARKSTQHIGERWKTIRAASHRGSGPMNLPTK